MTRPSHLVLAVLAVMPIAETARAQIAGAPAEQQNPTPGNRNPAPTGEPMSGAGLFSDQRTNLLGDLFGLRASAGNDGISFGLTETSEVFGNATGGIRRGADYDGLTTIGIGLDTQKALGWQGGVFNVSALQIHGRDLSADDLFSLNTNSGIEADRTFRLWEAWYQQSFIGGMADIKIGQQSLDQEFINSLYAGTFINTMMGWPVVPSYDLYAGGPAYPLASLGIRLRVRATPALTILAGVFDDNPSGGPFDNDPLLRRAERSGTEFNLGTGALVFAEAQYAIDQPSPSPSGSGSGLPGTYRFGGWFDSASFLDQDLDGDDVSLASSLSTGSAHARRRNFSLYAVADQMIWRPDPQGPRSLGVFMRIMGAPDDRNLVSFGLNAGLVLKAPLPGRKGDSLGLGYGLAKVGSEAIRLDSDIAALSTAYSPIRSSESFLELTYQAQIAPWWQVQPDVQYVFLPGGGLADPGDAGRRIGNEAVFGVRTNVTFWLNAYYSHLHSHLLRI